MVLIIIGLIFMYNFLSRYWHQMIKLEYNKLRIMRRYT